MTNYDDFTFGVEIEFTGAELSDVEVGMQAVLLGTNIDVVREGYNHITRDHWKITTDATVTEHRNYSTGTGFGGELVSPVLRGNAGFAELEQVLAALNSVAGVSVDVRCGLHVHLSWDSMDVQQVKNIVKRYSDFETTIDSFMPNSRRANNSRWCSSISRSYPLRSIAAHSGSLRRMAGLAGRYYKINLQSLSRYGTIEFRQHSGTTDYTKISNWVKFLMEFCDSSKTLSSAASTNYRRSRKIAYGEIREQVAAQGFELRFASTHYKLFNEDGEMVERVEFDTLEAMYVDAQTTRELNQNFVDWFSARFGGSQVDSLFRGISNDVTSYLNQRATQLA